jgi:3-hydroxy-9,10-secoandrosta-1,3,5(10)-triene-9,17-dione monooxygenase
MNADSSVIPTSEELVRRAQALIPKLREQAEEVERDRMVPPATIEEFKRAGFFKILQPRR